jgi:hypothetical protein
MSGLKTSRVHRKLDAQIKIMGLELMDLIAVLMLAAVSNIFLGRTSFAPVFVLGIPALMAVILYFVKRDKPEGYLIHLFRYISSPGFYSAAQTDEALASKRERFIE